MNDLRSFITNAIDLAITTHGVALYKSGESLVVSKDKKLIKQVPIRRISSVTLFTDRVRLTGAAINLCVEHNIPIVFMGNASGVSAIVNPSKSDSPELQLAQAQRAKSIKFASSICCEIIEGKIRNQINLLRYFEKSRKLNHPGLQNAMLNDLNKMKRGLARIHEIRNQHYKQVYDNNKIEEIRNSLLGIEGQAAIAYWHSYGLLLPKQIRFPGRIRQGATDPVNSSLNYGYAILKTRVEHAVVCSGLSLQTSFLHSPQTKRPSLVFDLMEEFRPWSVDRQVLNFICQKNKNVIENNNPCLSQTAKRLLVQVILERWQKDGISKLIFQQVNMLKQAIMMKGDYRSHKFKW